MNHFHRTIACIVTVTILPTTANSDFTFRQVARTGDFIPPGSSSAVASFGHWVSMNDAGQVAFKAKRQDGSEIIVKATPVSGSAYYQFEVIEGGSFTFGDYVGINKQGEASYRRKTGVAFDIMRDGTRIAFATTATNDPYNFFFKGLMSQTDINTPTSGGEAEVSFYATVLDDNGYTLHNQIRKGHDSGPQSYYVSHSTLIASHPEFSSFGTSTSINDAGLVVFTGSHPTLGTGIFMGDGSSFSPVATTTTGFTTTGTRPSINNDNQVALYGIGPAGEGIYIGTNGSAPDRLVPVGNTLLAIEATSHIAINDGTDVAFIGTTTGDIPGLFHSCGKTVDVVIKTGDEINGLAPIDAIVLWDGLNASGDVAFWSRHSDLSESLVVAHGWPCPGSHGAWRAAEQSRATLPPPYMSQKNPQWRDICLGELRCCYQIPSNEPLGCVQHWVCDGTAGECLPPPAASCATDCAHCNQCTIGHYGCTLTCATMLYNYYVHQLDPWQAVGPPVMNGEQVFANSYEISTPRDRLITNEIDRYRVAAVTSRDDPLGRKFRVFNIDKITTCAIEAAMFCTGAPVIVRVVSLSKPPSYPELTHSILCYGIDFTATDPYRRILIYDPSDDPFQPTRTTLATYKDRLNTKSYGWTIIPGNAGGCVFGGYSPIELLVTDQYGHRTGYDASTGDTLNEIPGAIYIVDRPDDLDPPEPPEPRSKAHKTIYIPAEVRGSVALTVLPLEQATASVQIVGWRADGSVAFASANVMDVSPGVPISEQVVMPVSADFDVDGDVDLADFGRLQNCFGGAEVPPTEACGEADLNGSGRVDLVDVNAFVKVTFTGPL